MIKNDLLYTGRKVVIIGAGDFQIPLILKAKELGFETHVFAWKEGAIGEKEEDFFYPIDIRKKEEILQVCRAIGPDAVTSIASDLASITVQYICERLNLTCNSIHCVNLTTNKFEMRKALKKSGIFVPTFQIIKSSYDLLEVVDWAYPIIVKPVDRSGSRGITKVYNQIELKVAIETAIHVSFDESAIVEEFIEGSEYSCETISFQGEHYFLAFTKKYTTGEPDFIETGHLQEEFLLKERKEEIIREVFRGLDALEIKEGAAHTEFKITPQGDIRIIEIGARMGGDRIGSDLVYLSTGYDYLKMVLQVACGEPPEIVSIGNKKVAYIHFIFDKKDLYILRFFQKWYKDKIYYLSEIHIDENKKIIDSGSRYGYFILVIDNMEQLEEIIERYKLDFDCY